MPLLPLETPADVSPAGETGAFGPPTPASVVFGAALLPPSPPVVERSRRRWWAAAALLAVVGLVSALLIWWPRPPHAPPAAPHHRELTPGVWHNLLDHRPVPLFWPAGAFPPQFDEKRQRLLVNCTSFGLLSLGTVPPGFRYQVQLGFIQPHWTGGVGLFFGYHESENGVAFQEIELVPTGRGKTRFGLCRSKGEMRTLPGGELFPVMHELVTQDSAPSRFPRTYTGA